MVSKIIFQQTKFYRIGYADSLPDKVHIWSICREYLFLHKVFKYKYKYLLFQNFQLQIQILKLVFKTNTHVFDPRTALQQLTRQQASCLYFVYAPIWW